MEITDWLRGLSLERYADTFRDNAISIAVLRELSESDLEKLGVLLGHRKIMLRAIETLRSDALDGKVESSSPSALVVGEAGISANASETKPAKLLAVFVVDSNETELTTPFGE